VLSPCPRAGPQAQRLLHQEGRLPGDIAPVGWVKDRPDLAVEVISPGDTAEEIEQKLHDDKKAGIPLIWVIYPRTRTARIFRLAGSPEDVAEDGEISGEDIIPGFRCPLREIVPPPQPAEKPQAAPAGPNGAGSS
jgi:hypothetical protein